MPNVSEEQVGLARRIDLLTYLQENEQHELLQRKNDEYRTASHGSFVISYGNNTGIAEDSEVHRH